MQYVFILYIKYLYLKYKDNFVRHFTLLKLVGYCARRLYHHYHAAIKWLSDPSSGDLLFTSSFCTFIAKSFVLVNEVELSKRFLC